jgi:hypothetical protein
VHFFVALVAASVLLVARDALVAERTEKGHAIVESVWSTANMRQREAKAGNMSGEGGPILLASFTRLDVPPGAIMLFRPSSLML